MVIEVCKECKGTGWKETIPCIVCNTRGVVSDQLYDDKLKNYPSKDDNRI